VVNRLIQQNLANELEMVERHILQSELGITCQRHRIENDESNAAVATLSRSLLAAFQTCLALHYDHRKMVLREMRAVEQK
jgi:hypothetical protein